MEFTTKIIIPILIIGLISILCITTHIFDTIPTSNKTVNVMYESGDDIKYKQTPYVIQPQPTKIFPITPTPTPLYCEEILDIFNTQCMGAIKKDDEYCSYWESESRKKCSFIQW